MRILVSSSIVAPEIGGPATFLEGLLPALRERGHEVRVLAYGDDPQAGYAIIRPDGSCPACDTLRAVMGR